MNPTVTEKVCRERRKVMDERFARDKLDIRSQKERTRKLEEMTIVMGQILERMEGRIDDHDHRIKALEDRPRIVLGKWETAVISSVVGLLLGFVSSLPF